MNNIVFHQASVTRSRREQLNGHRSVLLWFTGLSGAGKSTLAHALEERLHQLGCRTFVMDGDNVRFGLCSDLTFSDEDRKENIRRIAEASKLMVEAGILTMTAFISPFRAERLKARQLFPHGDFIEIYCSTPIQVCESRDVKGLYKKARAGEVKNFTGISSPYEPPLKPELTIDTSTLNLEAGVQTIVDYLTQKGILSTVKQTR